MFHVLAFAVSMDKPNGFIGRDALVEYRKNGAPKKRIVQFVLSDPDAQLWGGELVLRNGGKVGEVRSAAYGYTLNASFALVQLEHAKGVTKEIIESGEYQIDLAGDLFDATAHIRTPYDPI
jgi:4-methylaminobutanoate oxidase (formaldehyde-forming)